MVIQERFLKSKEFQVKNEQKVLAKRRFRRENCTKIGIIRYPLTVFHFVGAKRELKYHERFHLERSS